MKKSSISVGLIFVFIGILIIGGQLGLFDFSIYSFTYFIFKNLTTVVSMVLIVVGINIIFRKYPIMKKITWIASIAAIIVLSQLYPSINKEKKFEKREIYEDGNHFEIEKKDETLYGELDLNLGAVKINVDSTDDKLIKGNINGVNFKSPKISYKDDNKKVEIKLNSFEEFSVSDLEFLFNKENIKFEDSNLFLNEDVLWDIDLNLGVVDTEFDISNLQVEKLKLNGGAGKFKLIIGERQEEIKIDINAGASDINIYVPKDSGIKVKNTGVLNSLEFDGITAVKDDKHYLTENFDDAENKIKIDVKMGAGNITINAIE